MALFYNIKVTSPLIPTDLSASALSFMPSPSLWFASVTGFTALPIPSNSYLTNHRPLQLCLSASTPPLFFHLFLYRFSPLLRFLLLTVLKCVVFSFSAFFFLPSISISNSISLFSISISSVEVKKLQKERLVFPWSPKKMHSEQSVDE